MRFRREIFYMTFGGRERKGSVLEEDVMSRVFSFHFKKKLWKLLKHLVDGMNDPVKKRN